MAKWKIAGIVVVMVGLVAFGAFAAQHRATMSMTRTQACAAECSEECEPAREMREEMRQELRQELRQQRLQQLLGEENGGRQTRRAGVES